MASLIHGLLGFPVHASGSTEYLCVLTRRGKALVNQQLYRRVKDGIGSQAGPLPNNVDCKCD